MNLFSDDLYYLDILVTKPKEKIAALNVKLKQLLHETKLQLQSEQNTNVSGKHAISTKEVVVKLPKLVITKLDG